MVYDTGEKYLKEINHVSILEPIEEIFDGITDLLTPNAVLYGSTVTAVLTGLPIEGDLDVSVSQQEYVQLVHNINNSVKWLQISGKVPGRMPFDHRLVGLKKASDSPTPSDKKYGGPGAKHLPISKVISFENTNHACVQIMESKSVTGDMLEDALDVVRKVDFTFCGIAVDRYGRLLEVLPHSYSDCLARVIRVGDYQPRLSALRLKERFLKYVKRGWSPTMSMDQMMLNLKNAKTVAMKAAAARPKKKRMARKFKAVWLRMTPNGVRIFIKQEVIDIVGSNKYMCDIMTSIAHKSSHNISLRRRETSTGIEWSTDPGSSKLLNATNGKALVDDVERYIVERYGVNEAKVKDIQKKLRLKRMYGGVAKGSSSYKLSTDSWGKGKTSTSSSDESW